MPRPSYQRTLEGQEQRAEIIRLRRQRLPFAEIGRRLGITGQRCGQLYKQALAEIPRQQVEEHRAEELQELEYLAKSALDVLHRRHVTISNGRVVSMDGKPISDDGPVLAAIDRLLKIQERKSRLLGLDAPARHEVVTLDAIDAEISRLASQLASGTETTEAPNPAFIEG